MAYTQQPLSASTDGQGILISGTATGSSETIHTAGAGVVDYDKVYLWASNNSNADATLTIEYGEDTATKTIQQVIPYRKGLQVVLPGTVTRNANVIKAFASTADVITLQGYVGRTTA